jgi:15-cis-phytoene synthase
MPVSTVPATTTIIRNPAATASAVAKNARSNLAFSLACLPRQRRRDMIAFYAFCRVVDDLADEGNLSLRDRRIQLGAWKRIVRGEQAPADAIAAAVIELPRKYGFDAALLEEVIDGVSTDLEVRRFQTFDALRTYCYKVASVVGLVSLPIFGLPQSEGHDYAVNLGLALQLTNILRDIRVDWENDQRLYLPMEDLSAHGCSIEDIAGRRRSEAFLSVMRFESDRALGYFAAALDSRPRKHLRLLQSAEAMRKIYLGLLRKMRADRFGVFERRYRLHSARKALILAGSIARGWCPW